MNKKVNFSELPDGAYRHLTLIFLLVVGLFIMTLGIIFSVTDSKMSEVEWQVQQEQNQLQTYEQYSKDREQVTNIGGTVLIVAGALVFLCMVAIGGASTQNWGKCPNGHVVYLDKKSTNSSYCHICGSRIYSQQELSPDEWKKRYGE